MKKIGRFICFTTLFLLIAGCKQQKTIRYELVDGNPQKATTQKKEIFI